MVDNLWAPWRMEFIESARKEEQGDCVFCSALQDEHDRDRLLLHRGKHAFVVMNKYPYTNGHLLILPNRHLAELHDLTGDESAEMMTLMGRSIRILRQTLCAEGINGGLNLGKCAGAGIRDHVHFHLVPRWVGDTNFLPVFSNTRTLPEYLHETYDRLIPEF